ncbi:MAG TPA: hypothetical protein VN455_14125 [Methanotrichaceae archaeon]|nr:hypothetical protein [Methanotrichaceae archaeon]
MPALLHSFDASPDATTPATEGVPSHEVLRIATASSPLAATITTSMISNHSATCIVLNNSGAEVLRSINVTSAGGETLGFLASLSPGENQTIITDADGAVAVTGLDSMGRKVPGVVYDKRYQEYQPNFGSGDSSGSGSGSSSVKASSGGSAVTPGSAEAASPASSASSSTSGAQTEVQVPSDSAATGAAAGASSPGLCLSIQANRTEAREGDVVGYRCQATNSGHDVLYGLELRCGGKMSNTSFIGPGQEIHMDGLLEVNNSTLLRADAQCKDIGGNWSTNNTSLKIWKICPDLKLRAEGPSGKVHRGDQVAIRVTVENAGDKPVRDLNVSDTLGEIGKISLLGPGESRVLLKNWTLDRSLSDHVQVVASGNDGQEVYASSNIDLGVLSCGLDLLVEPSEIVAYSGEPVEVVWALNNTGEEVLKNVTLMENGAVKARLKEIYPGKSMRVAAVYSLDKAARINVSALGYDRNGHSVSGHGNLVIRSVSPGVKLDVAPSDISACFGQEIDITCVVSNSGNDLLTGIGLYRDGTQAAKIDKLAPGDFRVFSSKFKASSNRTIAFKATGSDSRSRPWSDESSVNISLARYAIKLSASPEPDLVPAGGQSRITCTVDNPSNVSIYDVFIISKTFGPLGTIDFIAPGSQKSITAVEKIDQEISDLVTAEGFTSAKESVRDRCDLKISLTQKPLTEEPLQGPAESRYSADVPGASADGNDSWDNVPGDNISGDGEIYGPISLQPIAGAGNSSDENSSASEPKTVHVQSSDSSSGGLKSDGGIDGLVRYIQKMVEQIGLKASEGTKNDSDNYVLGIESIKGSDHSSIKILDVNAMPPEPVAGASVKVSVHVRGDRDIQDVALQWGLAVTAMAKQNVLDVDRAFTTRMTMESSDGKDSYWSCTIPGHSAGTYMVLSVTATDGSGTAENGPFMLRWNDVDFKHAKGSVVHNPNTRKIQSTSGLLYIESTSVSGRGEVSIKDQFHESSMNYEEKMKGFGSVNLESVRTVDKGMVSNFTESRDLLFEGQLKGMRSLESPNFQNGLGASVTERFNMTRIDKTETDMIRSIARSNNTLAFRTDQAFDGMWNIRTQYAQFAKKIKADQKYTGQFQTAKDIQFQD